jgi:hypothetical protein
VANPADERAWRRPADDGVDTSGQSGSIADLYDLSHLLPEQLVNAALTVVEDPR